MISFDELLRDDAPRALEVNDETLHEVDLTRSSSTEEEKRSCCLICDKETKPVTLIASVPAVAIIVILIIGFMVSFWPGLS